MQWIPTCSLPISILQVYLCLVQLCHNYILSGFRMNRLWKRCEQPLHWWSHTKTPSPWILLITLDVFVCVNGFFLVNNLFLLCAGSERCPCCQCSSIDHSWTGIHTRPGLVLFRREPTLWSPAIWNIQSSAGLSSRVTPRRHQAYLADPPASGGCPKGCFQVDQWS